jgi:hypothetical protein
VPDRERDFPGFHSWPRRYCVSKVGVNEEVICEYIQNQKDEDKREEHFTLRRLEPPSFGSKGP